MLSSSWFITWIILISIVLIYTGRYRFLENSKKGTYCSCFIVQLLCNSIFPYKARYRYLASYRYTGLPINSRTVQLVNRILYCGRFAYDLLLALAIITLLRSWLHRSWITFIHAASSNFTNMKITAHLLRWFAFKTRVLGLKSRSHRYNPSNWIKIFCWYLLQCHIATFCGSKFSILKYLQYVKYHRVPLWKFNVTFSRLYITHLGTSNLEDPLSSSCTFRTLLRKQWIVY